MRENVNIFNFVKLSQNDVLLGFHRGVLGFLLLLLLARVLYCIGQITSCSCLCTLTVVDTAAAYDYPAKEGACMFALAVLNTCTTMVK